LHGSNEAGQGSGLANHGRDLGSRRRQHPDFVLAKDPGFDCLNHQNALQHPSINERDPEKRLVSIFPGFPWTVITNRAWWDGGLIDNTPLKRLTRTIVFLPVVIGLSSSSLLWFWLLDEQVGLLNKLLVDLHLIREPIVWFATADLAFWAVVISITWKVVGFGMVLFIAGIQSINPDILEAALMDGASYWGRVRLIILPLTRRVLLLTTLVSAIGSMLAFDQFYIMTSGGPRGQTFTAVYWIYQNSFISFKLGYGAALSIVLMFIILVFATMQIALTARSAET